MKTKPTDNQIQTKINQVSDEISTQIGVKAEDIKIVLAHILAGKSSLEIWSDVYWPYWDRRDTDAPHKCNMLDLCLRIEQWPGIVVYFRLPQDKGK